MTEHDGKIPPLTKGRVREQLADERDSKAIKRLTAAREYLEGLSPAQIEDKCGWSRQTIYNWLNRFEERGVDAALFDDPRPGRPPELDDDQFERFADALQEPPTEVGYDEPVWSSHLAQQYLLEEFDVTHSQRHVRRFMHKLGVFPKRPRPSQPLLTKPNERSSTTPSKKSRPPRQGRDCRDA